MTIPRWFAREVDNHSNFPAWQGIAHQRISRETSLTLLIPFNLIYRFFYPCIWLVKAPMESSWERSANIGRYFRFVKVQCPECKKEFVQEVP